MAEYYVDPAAGGADDGSSWTDAWTSLQSAADTAVAGDIVYCRGTQTLAAKIDFDTNSGDKVSGLIKFIGCNASGDNDGTRFTLDGNSAATYCIEDLNQSYLYFENLELKNATSHGWYDGNSDPDIKGIVFVNSPFHNNGGHGCYGQDSDAFMFIKCSFYSNSSYGLRVDSGSFVMCFFCSAHDNTDAGVRVQSSQVTCIGLLSYDNGATGIWVVYSYYGGVLFNCVADKNAESGIVVDGADNHFYAIVGNRITNHVSEWYFGMELDSAIVLHGWNYFEDNYADIDGDGLATEILESGVGTNDEDNADTNEGYTDKTDGSEDYNLRSDASLRRTAITIPTS